MSLYPAQDCGPLDNPANGSSIGDLTVFPNKIIFGCDEGFLLRGSNIRNCQANGAWSGNQTICEGWFLSFPFIPVDHLEVCFVLVFFFGKIVRCCNRAITISLFLFRQKYSTCFNLKLSNANIFCTASFVSAVHFTLMELLM